MRVLLATDLSEGAERAHNLVKAAAWPEGTVVRVITSLEPVSMVAGLSPEVVVQFDDDAVEEIRKGVRTVAEGIARAGITAEHEVLLGRAADQIIAEARSFKADLVVVSNRGRGPFATTLLGSVSAEVVDRAPCPVLVARGTSLQKLVVAEDGSHGARIATELLATLPIMRSTTATVLTVIDIGTPWILGADPSMLAGVTLEAYDQALEALRAQGEADAKATAERLTAAGIKATAKTRDGHPAHEIVAEANESAADAIVLGSRGHTGLARLVLGSVAHSVLTHAPCSVLIVHAPHPKGH